MRYYHTALRLLTIVLLALPIRAQTTITNLSNFSTQPKYFISAWLHGPGTNQFRLGFEQTSVSPLGNSLVIQKTDNAGVSLVRGTNPGPGPDPTDNRYIGAAFDGAGNLHGGGFINAPTNLFGIPFTISPPIPLPADYYLPRKSVFVQCYGSFSILNFNTCPSSSFRGRGLVLATAITMHGFAFNPNRYTVQASTFTGTTGTLVAPPGRQAAIVEGLDLDISDGYTPWEIRLVSDQLTLPDYYSASLGTDGVAYVTATFRDSVQVGSVVYRQPGTNSLVVIFEPNGLVRRVDILNGLAVQAVQAAPDQPGAYYVVAQAAAPALLLVVGGTLVFGQRDFWLRVGPTGSTAYVRQPFTALFSAADILSIKTDAAGNTYQVVSCNSLVGFGPVLLSNVGSPYVAVASYTPSGQLRWVRRGTAGPGGTLTPQSFVVDSPDQVSVVLDTPPNATLAFSPVQVTTVPLATPGTLLYGVTLTRSPYILTQTRAFNAGAVTITVTGANLSGTLNAWIGTRKLRNVSVNLSGTQLTGTTTPGNGSYGYVVVETPEGFGASLAPISKPGGNDDDDRNENATNRTLSGLSAYPTISEGTVTIAGPLPDTEPTARVEVLDLMGQVRQTVLLPVENGRVQGEVSTRGLAPGSYVLRVSSGGQVSRFYTVVR